MVVCEISPSLNTVRNRAYDNDPLNGLRGALYSLESYVELAPRSPAL